MSIYTPRGLRIRFGVDYCFALIARLYPAIPADRVFRTAEGLASLSSALGFAAGLASLAVRLPASMVLAITAIGCVAGFLLAHQRIARGVLAAFGGLYRDAAWLAIPPAAALLAGLLLSGWRATLAYFVGRGVGALGNKMLDRLEASQMSRRVGMPLGWPERSFLAAYELHARAAGRPVDLLPRDEEFEADNWHPAFREFERRFPKAIEKFT